MDNQSPFYPSPPLPFYQNPNLMGANSSPHILISPHAQHHTFPSTANHSPYFFSSPPQQPPNNQPPVQQPRRYRTIKRLVQIPQGRLVLDCPVPVQYLDKVPLREGREFEKMRYTAITCDPSEFVQKNYTLRQDIMKRETEIVICITMYNVCFFCF